MVVLYNWNTRVEGRSCFTLVLIYWRKKPQNNNQIYSIWWYRVCYVLNNNILSRNILKQPIITTSQSFDWTNELHFFLSSLQNWGNCVSFIMLLPLHYFFSLIFCISQYDMQFFTWESNIIALKYILKWIHFYNVV